jgi:hypothetical protein
MPTVNGGARKILPKPQKNALEGYSTHQPSKSRRSKLTKLVSKKGYATIIRDLNLRATLSKNKAPGASKKMKSDMKYLKKKSKC